MNKDIFDYQINGLMNYLEKNKDNLSRDFDFMKYEIQSRIEAIMYQSFEDYRESLKEIDRLNNIIEELEKWLKNIIKEHKKYDKQNNSEWVLYNEYYEILDKLKELKENTK